MPSILPLLLALAAAQPAAPSAAVSPEALEACEALPPDQQPACVEPFLEQLPPEFADLMRTAMDPAVQAEMKAWERAVNDAMHAHARSLAASGNARDQLAAVMVWPMTFPGDGEAAALPAEVQGWFRAARAAAPADPLVAWVEATDCGTLATDCDQAGALERLLRVDGDNAPAHLLAALRASHAGDPEAMRAHVGHAAEAPRFDPYDQQLLELMFASHQAIEWPAMPATLAKLWGRATGLGVVMTSDEWGLTRMMGYWMAMTNPIAGIPYCSDLDGAAAGFRADCVAVLGMLADDVDSLMNQSVALPRLVRLTAGTEAAPIWRERLRQHDWLLEKALPLAAGTAASGMSGFEYVEYRVTEGESAALRELLRRAGLPDRAPGDWMPERASHRELLEGPAAGTGAG